MGILRFTKVFKDYSSLLVPVTLGLVAVLLFIPVQLMSSKLKNEITDESISKRGKQVQSLSRNATAAEQWKVEKEYQATRGEDANQIALLAKQSTQRQLLSYKIFPKPKDISILIFEEFGEQFCNGVDALIARVNAGGPPTDVELKKSMQSYSSSGSYRGAGMFPGMPFMTPSYQGSSGVETAIKDALCRAKAESALVYANPANLSGYEFWGRGETKSGKSDKFTYTGVDEAVKDCWYYQLAYWIIEDVIDTIGALNSESESVFTSPVKRLMAVSFTTSGYSSSSRSTTTRKGDGPSYVLTVNDGLTKPWTGRLCNNDIDVVHFRVVVIVSTKKAVLPFMQQLCSARQHRFRGFFGESEEQIFKHNQITILESNIRSIDREEQTHNLYRYGEDAVVELDLICEYTFNKNGYNEIKPESVKKTDKS